MYANFDNSLLGNDYLCILSGNINEHNLLEQVGLQGWSGGVETVVSHLPLWQVLVVCEYVWRVLVYANSDGYYMYYYVFVLSLCFFSTASFVVHIFVKSNQQIMW